MVRSQICCARAHFYPNATNLYLPPSSVSVKLKHCTPKDEYPLIILIYFRRSLAVYPRFLAPLPLSFSLSVFFFSPSLVLHLANFFPFLCSPLAKIAMSYPTNVNTFHAWKWTRLLLRSLNNVNANKWKRRWKKTKNKNCITAINSIKVLLCEETGIRIILCVARKSCIRNRNLYLHSIWFQHWNINGIK